MFTILINKVLNDLSCVIESEKINALHLGYLDDLTIVEKVVDGCPKTQRLLDCISESTKAIKMIVNPRKCEFMVIDNARKKISTGWSFNMDGISIPRVSETTLLGVKINDKLNWDSHVNSIICKANSKLYLSLINYIRVGFRKMNVSGLILRSSDLI